MAVKTFYVKGKNSAEAAEKAVAQLKDFSPELVLFFASGVYEESNPAAEMKKAFPDSYVIGCTSHSEFCNSEFLSGAFSIMAVDKDSVEDVCVRVVQDIKGMPEVAEPVAEINQYFGGSDQIFDHFDQYVGIVLFESGAKSEEYMMDKLGTATDILFVGGSSSAVENDISRVYAEGISYENAMVLAVLKTVNGYDILKTQSAQIFSERGLLVTKSDLNNRILYEFDHRPCGEVYAEVLGISARDIQDYFVSNPLGVVADDEIFVRTFNQIQEEGISLHCGIPEGTEIQILKIGNIVEDTKAALDRVIDYKPAGLINFNCLYRTLEIQNKNLIQPYCDLFGKYASMGFSTSGEAFLGHINETSTILVIK